MAAQKHTIKIVDRIVLTVCSYHVTYAFQSESTLYSCLNVKELLVRSRHEIQFESSCSHLEMFCIFECLLTQNPTSQDAQLS